MSQTKKSATAEDQLQINKFARLHKNYLEVKNELLRANNEAQNLADADDELTLLDDTEFVPIQIGSIFVHFDQESAMKKLGEIKQTTVKQISELKATQARLEEELKQLRAVLYAKFGDNIHLEMEADE